MKKRYLFFSARYLPYLGGVERYTYNLAKYLTKAGNQVIIITSLIGEEPVHEIREEAEIFRLPSFNLLNGRFPVLKINRKTNNIFRTLQKIKIDYAVINTRFYPLSYRGSAFARKNRIPAICIEHGTGHFTVNNKLLDHAGHLYEHFISFLINRNIKNYYGVSFECNKWLKHFNIDAKGVLYNAIDGQEIQNLSMKRNKEIEKEIQYNEKDIIITFTGRLIKEKGVTKLISAFQEIKEKYPNLKLCIAGDGDLYDDIINLDLDRIYLLGKISFDKIISLLGISCIFCLPTDYPEGLPTSVLEAGACKNYIITTKYGGSKEVITDSSYGTIMDKNDIAVIKKEIIKVLENKQLRESASQKIYDRIMNNFTWMTTSEELINTFKTIDK